MCVLWANIKLHGKFKGHRLNVSMSAEQRSLRISPDLRNVCTKCPYTMRVLLCCVMCFFTLHYMQLSSRHTSGYTENMIHQWGCSRLPKMLSIVLVYYTCTYVHTLINPTRHRIRLYLSFSCLRHIPTKFSVINKLHPQIWKVPANNCIYIVTMYLLALCVIRDIHVCT